MIATNDMLTVQKLKVLKVIFNGQIAPHEIQAFRAAIAKKVGWEHTLFHNHQGDGYRYRYPLIQYKTIRGHPCLICLGIGVEEIHHFFSKKDWSIHISGRTLDMQVEQLDLHQFTMQVWDKMFDYRLHNWIALNQKTAREFQQFTQMEERIPYLEKKLIGNILSFAKGINWHVDKPIQVSIQHLPPPRSVRCKGIRVLGFSPVFQSNVFLPLNLGLGRSVSLGYGVIQRPRQRSTHVQEEPFNT